MVTPKFMDTKSVLLVDGNNLLLRILFSKNKGGTLLSQPEIIQDCAMIFIHQIVTQVRKYSCDRVYVAFDRGGSLRKKAIFEEYKKNRENQATTGYSAAFGDPDTSLFVELKTKTIQLCSMFSLPVFHEYGIEADDMIGVATEELAKLGKTVVILSNDSDFLQLVNYGNVVCAIPYKKADVTKDNFTEYFSECSKSKGVMLSASEYIFYKTIVGDTSDNIDGIKGLGYKRLHKLMEEQLKIESQETRDLYMRDTLAYVEHLANSNTTTLEKLVASNLDLIIRNYKLIELSSKYASPSTVGLTLKKLLEVPEAPSKKEAIKNFHQIFPGSPHIEFILNTVFSFRNLYQGKA
jgi:DNA polymerase-1